ncbi:translation initiation factor IF-2 [Peribacillus frigoritolerans]|mgnify:CR=1 FL=1|jgi:translation initiation factor IF-2|uniref:Translation initiation factor IF-2 n=2 Tax=Peribacillus TaxID=2675229 RepID=A0AAW9NF88_9BACI|nr:MULTISPECIES: translation initiation factor IF-2 [Bacillaceae]KOR78183.1 translation initiation factor IF-2 [Bacillus sp. FJAT-21352]KRF50325.1 translation initiation factor IF-2 [Bacillus sp. Soil745]MBD8134024.1 translation initiation factor IF-2 [Bacillus sp. CFBP 13597]MEC0274283.1 translation initiation factor IF-2 [Peribacillus castrilensis]PEF39023.1 translation initiation factor IF-2 [Bacillus sp. AFS094228]PEO50911.1 translation initiation factor IF-2 [Bacillus sp. AFS026049]PHD7
MTKLRVYEYAKQKNVSSKDVINKLKEMNIEVTNHMTALDDSTVNKLNDSIKPKNEDKSQEPKANATVAKYEAEADEKSTVNKEKLKKKPPVKPVGTKKPTGGQFNKGRNNKNKNNKQRQQAPQAPVTKRKERELPEKITFYESLTVMELGKKLHREPSEIIKKLFMLGVMATINQTLDKDAIELICAEYGVVAEEEIRVDLTDLESLVTEDASEDLIERPAVVTIMGHVDHGKTTLLDSIRHTKVTEGEAGGITQHIGAYQVKVNDKKITFLDTPGHAAFTTMRARGAQVTDITILVVAADDGVMPQTIEAINHAKAAEVPIIVAVNKMDKEAANPDRVMQELTEHGLVSEAWGGDTIFVPISAKNGEGIDSLLEMILLVSEVEEYKANPSRKANGTVIEARLDKGRGSVATLLVQNGTLKIGDPIVIGNTFGRVRAMVNDLGRRVKDAGPSTPVEITGLNEVPQAGDRFIVFEDEKTARQVGEVRAQRQLASQRNEKSRVTLDTLFEQMKEGEIKELNIILKADVQGSAEAVAASLNKIEVEGAKVKIIHIGVGAITESDIILATASNAIVIGFNVRPDVNAKRAAESENVDVRLHRIIYKAIEEIESAMKGMLDPEFEEKIIGQAEVRTTFKVSKVGTIAGSYVTEGKITRDSGIRLIREGVVIYEGEIDALKRFKDDVKEVATNYECGITIKNYNDLKEGDVIEAYVMEEIERK